MLTRRLIRIKVFKLLFSYNYNRKITFSSIDNELIKSCEATLLLYYFILSLPVALKDVAKEKIEIGLKKYKPTPQERVPNRRFVENEIIQLIERSGERKRALAEGGISWENYLPFVKKLYAIISERDYFIEYMGYERLSHKRNIQLIVNILQQELLESEELDSLLEDLSLY